MNSDEESDSIIQKIKLGRKFRQNGDKKRAKECYQWVMDYEPKNTDLWEKKAALFLENKEYKFVLKCCEKMEDPASYQLSALYILGSLHRKRGKKLKALECYNKALEIYPDSRVARNVLGEMFFDAAREFKEKAESSIHQGPRLPLYIKALKFFREYHHLHPKPSDMYEQRSIIQFLEELGDIFLSLSQYNEALEIYEIIVQYKPKKNTIWNKMASIHFLLNDYQKSLECYNTIIESDPNNGEILNSIGDIYKLIGDKKKAESYYQKANQKINPKIQKLLITSKDYFEKGENDKLMENLGKILELDEYNKEATELMAKHYFPHDIDKAIEWYERLVFLDGSNSKAWCSLGMVYEFKELYEKAVECYEEALSYNKNEKEALKQLGSLFNELMDYKLSVHYFERYFRLLPNDQDDALKELYENSRANL